MAINDLRPVNINKILTLKKSLIKKIKKLWNVIKNFIKYEINMFHNVFAEKTDGNKRILMFLKYFEMK